MACRNRKGWRRTGPTPFVTSLDLDLIFDFYADHADPSCERDRTMLQVPQCVKGAHDGKKIFKFPGISAACCHAVSHACAT